MALFQGHDDLLEEYSFFFNHGSERMRCGIVSSSRPFSPQDEERPTNSNDAPAGEVLSFFLSFGTGTLSLDKFHGFSSNIWSYGQN